jgi:hypothetical protein
METTACEVVKMRRKRRKVKEFQEFSFDSLARSIARSTAQSLCSLLRLRLYLSLCSLQRTSSTVARYTSRLKLYLSTSSYTPKPMSNMPGGFGATKEATSEEQSILEGVRAEIEEKLGEALTLLELISFQTQVVAGVNYLFKVRSRYIYQYISMCWGQSVCLYVCIWYMPMSDYLLFPMCL